MSQPTYQEMSEVYNAVVGVSTFKKLMEKNKRLEKEVRALKNILYSIPEFRCKCNSVCTRRTKLRKEAVVKEEEDEEEVVVVVKQEKPVDVVVIDDVVLENVLMKISEKGDVAEGSEIDDAVSEEDAVEESEEEEEVVEEEVVEEEIVEESEEEEEESEEEVVEEVVKESEEEVVEEEEVEESEEVVEEEEGEEAEVFEITIGGKAYYTNDEINGSIYAIDENEEVGDEIGVFVDRKPTFKKK